MYKMHEPKDVDKAREDYQAALLKLITTENEVYLKCIQALSDKIPHRRILVDELTTWVERRGRLDDGFLPVFKGLLDDRFAGRHVSHDWKQWRLDKDHVNWYTNSCRSIFSVHKMVGVSTSSNGSENPNDVMISNGELYAISELLYTAGFFTTLIAVRPICKKNEAHLLEEEYEMIWLSPRQEPIPWTSKIVYVFVHGLRGSRS